MLWMMYREVNEMYYYGMTKESKKPNKTPQFQSVIKYELVVLPLTDRLQIEHCKTSLLHNRQPAPLTLLLQYWHSE